MQMACTVLTRTAVGARGSGLGARGSGRVRPRPANPESRIPSPQPLGLLLLVGLVVALSGCRSKQQFRFDPAVDHYELMATQIEYPDVAVENRQDVLETRPPHTILHSEQIEYRPLILEEAIQIALNNSQVIRDIGGRVVSAPTTVSSVYDPAIQQTDPRTGPEAALSAFDAQFSTSMFWAKNDRFFNNILFGGGVWGFQQDVAAFRAEITKTAATGTQFSLRNLTDYDMNNSPLNLFHGAYDTMFEAELRHPLLQGGGIEFNRIAGPQAKPGMYNGVLIARINTDITLADFETAVRNLVDDVEQAYWELYFAYRDLDARMAGQNAALQTWRLVERKLQVGTADREQEALAREQYFFLRAQAINALGGTSAGIQQVGIPSGAIPGVATGGVFSAERRLRRQLGLPASDGRLIRPADEPSTAPVVFDWEESLRESLVRRVELRKQKWTIKRRELELTAARNFLKMRLDFVGKYRWRGMGYDLLGNRNIEHGSAFRDLFTGDFQEWQLGLQLSTPIGNRIGHTAVRNAELLVARERAIFREQELQISHELSDAFGDLDRTHTVSRTNYNRLLAAHQQLDEVRKKFEAGLVPLDFLLDAQCRAVDADSLYYRSLVDYNLAGSQVLYARGTLLGHHGIYLTEGPWSEESHLAAAKQARWFSTKRMDYCITKPAPVSLGGYAQPLPPREKQEAVNQPPTPTIAHRPTPAKPAPAPSASARQTEIKFRPPEACVGRPASIGHPRQR